MYYVHFFVRVMGKKCFFNKNMQKITARNFLNRTVIFKNQDTL